MDINKYIPNIFGQAAPSYIQGLLGAEETRNLQNRANVQGLLGAGLALAQGMSRTGPRRSAAENILGALAGGFGAAGGAYDQGIKNYVTQQQIAQTQLAQKQALDRQAAITAASREDPALAQLLMIDPAEGAKQLALKRQLGVLAGQKGPETPDSLRAQAQQIYGSGNSALKPLGDSLMEKANRLEVEVLLRPQAPTAGVQQPTQEVAAEAASGSLPGVTVSEDNRLVNLRQQLINQNASLFGVPTKDARDQREANEKSIKSIDDQLKQLSASSFDWAKIEKDVPPNFKVQVDGLRRLSEGGFLPLEQIRIGVQEIYKQAQESAKGMRLDGIVGTYAQMKYGTMDQTKLTPDQMKDIIRFQNAPDAAKQAELARENQRLQFETGRGSVVPAGRDQFLSVPPTASNVSTQVPVQQATQVTPSVTPTQVTPAQSVPRQAPTQAATQAAPQAAPQPAPARTSTVIDPKVYKNPLISRPDSEVPPKKKQELIQSQPGLIAATNYTIKNIVDARNAAQSLLDNPAYLDALSGRTAPLRTAAPGGIVLDQEAFTANEILNNILGRSFISEIQEMRANSPTGGAVGNVAVAEMESLSKIRGAFKVGMDKAELKKQLESYISNANRAMKTIPNDYARTYGYGGEFDDLLASEVVSPKPTTQKLPPGVKVRRK